MSYLSRRRFFQNTMQGRINRPLSNEQLQGIAPSIFATEPAKSVSEDRYGFVPTYRIVEGMRAAGFVPVFAQETRVRNEEKTGKSRHMIRFQQADTVSTSELLVGDIFPQINLVNSHDALSSYQLFSGLYRKVCANGLCVPDSMCEGLRVRHTRNAVDEIINGSFEIVKRQGNVLPKIEEYKGITLDSQEQEIFASSALLLKYEPDEIPVTPQEILTPRRAEDEKNDLFTVFNRVQESIVVGGNRGTNLKTGRRQKTRGIGSIQENVKINKALFELTERMAQLKK